MEKRFQRGIGILLVFMLVLGFAACGGGGEAFEPPTTPVPPELLVPPTPVESPASPTPTETLDSPTPSEPGGTSPVIVTGGRAVDGRETVFVAVIRTDGTLWEADLGLADPPGFVQIGSGTWKSLAMGRAHTMAVNTDGSLWGWGWNEHGQLGDGTTEDRQAPVQIGIDTDWASVWAGWGQTVALKTDGSLWAWGLWEMDEAGQPVDVGRHLPVQVGPDTDWASLSTRGIGFPMAIKTDGSLWILWPAPVQIGYSTDWASVDSGGMAIKTDGSLWALDGMIAWAEYGGPVPMPVQVGTDTDWASVVGGLGFWGLKTDGSLWGHYDFDATPVQVAAGRIWSAVSLWYGPLFAIDVDGGLWWYERAMMFDFTTGEWVEETP